MGCILPRCSRQGRLWRATWPEGFYSWSGDTHNPFLRGRTFCRLRPLHSWDIPLQEWLVDSRPHPCRTRSVNIPHPHIGRDRTVSRCCFQIPAAPISGWRMSNIQRLLPLYRRGGAVWLFRRTSPNWKPDRPRRVGAGDLGLLQRRWFPPQPSKPHPATTLRSLIAMVPLNEWRIPILMGSLSAA